MSLLPAFMLVDRLTVTRPATKTRNALGSIVDGVPTDIVTGAPCRLDRIKTEGRPLEGGNRPEGRQVIYAYLNVDAQINDFVAVTRADGSIVDKRRVKNIDKPGLFRPSHQEIEIEPIGAS